jgi:hypothetical protein
MLNMSALTQTLSAMSLPQLQQYASLHKDDPYVVTMALSIANQKKQIQTAAQGQAGQQPMPKVVDQEISQMAPRPAPMPEAVGIGQLPAQNIAKMAGGGIVAFGEGGDVPRYKDEGLVRGQYYLDPITGEKVPVKTASGLLDEEKLRRLKQAGGDLWDRYMSMFATPEEKANKTWQLQDTPAQPAQPAVSAGMPDQTTAESTRLMAANAQAAPTAPSGNQPPAADKSATASPLYALTSPGFKPGEGLGFASSPTTLRSEMEMFKPQGEAKSPFEAQIRAAGAKEQEAEEAYKAKREQQIKELGIYGADQEQRLKGREEKLTGQEKELGPLALLQAGFAMMSGSSPFALQNIGIGAQTGLKHYAEGSEKLQNAKERLDDAYGRLEVARRSEKMLTQKELAELERNVNKVKTQTEKEVLNAAQQAYGMDRADSRVLFQAYADQAKAKAEATSRERLGLASLQAQKDIAGQRTALMQELYGGDAKARAEYGKVQKQVMTDLSKNLLYTNEPNEAKKQAMFNAEMQRALQANPFLSAYASGVGFTKAPPPGKVFDLTE